MDNHDVLNTADDVSSNEKKERGSWGNLFRGMWRTPWGLLGLVITILCFTLTVLGVLGEILGLIENPYAGVYIFLIFPMLGTVGIGIIVAAAYFRRREWHKYGVEKVPLVIDLGNQQHRKMVVRCLIISTGAFLTLGVISYEGYHFTDSTYFCGMVCHTVMEPEYTVYKQSSHAKVPCVECHIGSGASWYVRAKLSGLRQVISTFSDNYSKPIPVPVEHLRPARDTCEQCHWPEKFHGKKVKTFYHFTNEEQIDPEINEIALHVGGPNPETGKYEGIHWHVSKDVKVKYLAADRKRTQIMKVRVVRSNGEEEEFVKSDIEMDGQVESTWREMDCIDCHNRPTHKYKMPEERVDFGLRSKKINPLIPGIREDSLEVLQKKYSSRDEARRLLVHDLTQLQEKRHNDNSVQYKTDIEKAGEYLLDTYLVNVWPTMNIQWGQYKEHLGHQFEVEGFGCFRCHNDEHETANGNVISQDCDLCHEDP